MQSSVEGENGIQVKELVLQEQASDSTWTDDSTTEMTEMNERVPSYLQYDDDTLESFSFENISVQSIYGEPNPEHSIIPGAGRRNKLRQLLKVASRRKVIAKKSGYATKQACRSALSNSKQVSRIALHGTRKFSTLILERTRLVSRKIAHTTKSAFVRAKQTSGKAIAHTRDTSQATLLKTGQVSRKAVTHTCRATKSTFSNAKEASSKALAGSRRASNSALIKTKNVSAEALKRTQNSARLALMSTKRASKLAITNTREVTRSVISGTRRASGDSMKHSRNAVNLALVRTQKIAQNALLRLSISSRLTIIKAKVRARTTLNASKRAWSPIGGRLKATLSSVGSASRIMMARMLVRGNTIFRDAITKSQILILKLTLLSLKTKLVIENTRNDGRLVNDRYFTSDHGLIIEVDDEKECMDQFTDT